jgi:AcrR family transcriptional regulator
MKSTVKMTSEDRRAAIIRAVRTVFAEKGFHGTTTRELAQAAGVSEALLFKHFPNKEALYSAMLQSSCQEKEPGTFERLMALEPSAASLVLIVHLLMARLVGKARSGKEDDTIQVRLLQRSLMEDGDYARLLMQRMASRLIPKLEECIQAALAAGDAVEVPVAHHLLAWFTHHLAMILMLQLLPETPVVDYGVSSDRLVEQAVWFALRGLGLKDEMIRRTYHPGALSKFGS